MSNAGREEDLLINSPEEIYKICAQTSLPALYCDLIDPTQIDFTLDN
jgi:hypothetical protein